MREPAGTSGALEGGRRCAGVDAVDGAGSAECAEQRRRALRRGIDVRERVAQLSLVFADSP